MSKGIPTMGALAFPDTSNCITPKSDTQLSHKQPSETFQQSTPERNLVAAYLERRVRDYYHQEQTIRRTTLSWFDDPTIRSWGYLWTCDILDLDPIAIRHFIDKLGKPFLI